MKNKRQSQKWPVFTLQQSRRMSLFIEYSTINSGDAYMR